MNKTRNVSTCLALLTICAVSAASVAFANPPRLARDGGMSGGGGNLIPGRLPDTRLDPEEVKHRVKHSRWTAIEYVDAFKAKYQQGLLSEEQAALAAKAFGGTHDLSHVSRIVKPDVEEESPCYDFSGNPVDGSIVSDEAHEICISSHSVAAKVHESEIEAQSAALMLHEYSELIGFSEKEAETLQLQAYTDLLTSK